MLIQAHVQPILDDLRTKLVSIHKGETIVIPLLLDSGDEENIEVRISAIDVTKFVIRIEGATSYREMRSKVIALVRREILPATALAGYAEITTYP